MAYGGRHFKLADIGGEAGRAELHLNVSSLRTQATRRLLGVLLRQLDGFDGGKRSVVIAATNRKQDLDPALRSRFDAAVRFGLPDEPSRAQILAQYARHLSPPDLAALAAATGGFSGRDLRDVCEQAERRWASKVRPPPSIPLCLPLPPRLSHSIAAVALPG